MRVARVWLIVVACLVAGSPEVALGQGSVQAVEWPAPATSAAGFAAPWNLIQASSVAIGPRGTVLVLHRGAHPILEFDTAGKLLRSWGDGLISEGKVAGIPKENWSHRIGLVTRPSTDRPDARRAARTRCASIRRATSGSSMPPRMSSTR